MHWWCFELAELYQLKIAYQFKPTVFPELHMWCVLTRALLGLWISHRLLGGGAFEHPPPPWSRLLFAVEKNERQRSKAREKSFRNHFGHFLAQVKIGVSRGQNSKIFQNGFSTIKSLILKIKQRIWYHRVCPYAVFFAILEKPEGGAFKRPPPPQQGAGRCKAIYRHELMVFWTGGIISVKNCLSV